MTSQIWRTMSLISLSARSSGSWRSIPQGALTALPVSSLSYFRVKPPGLAPGLSLPDLPESSSGRRSSMTWPDSQRRSPCLSSRNMCFPHSGQSSSGTDSDSCPRVLRRITRKNLQPGAIYLPASVPSTGTCCQSNQDAIQAMPLETPRIGQWHISDETFISSSHSESGWT